MSTTLPKSIDDVLTEARAAINDSTVPFRFSNTLLLSYLNTALRETYRYRPDAFVGNFTTGLLSTVAVPTYSQVDLGLSPATPLPVDDRLFFNPIVFFVAGRTELSDDEFTDDGRAMSLLQSFRTMLIGPGG